MAPFDDIFDRCLQEEDDGMLCVSAGLTAINMNDRKFKGSRIITHGQNQARHRLDGNRRGSHRQWQHAWLYDAARSNDSSSAVNPSLQSTCYASTWNATNVSKRVSRLERYWCGRHSKQKETKISEEVFVYCDIRVKKKVTMETRMISWKRSLFQIWKARIHQIALCLISRILDDTLRVKVVSETTST